jgi:hypothetical protein
VYNKALSPFDISDGLLNVPQTLGALNLAYSQTSSLGNTRKQQDIDLYTGTGLLLLRGLEPGDHIRILSLTGSDIKHYYSTGNSISINSSEFQTGMYLLQLIREQTCVWTTKVIIPNPAL